MGPFMEAIVLVLMNLELWVEAAEVKVKAGTEARVPMEATDLK